MKKLDEYKLVIWDLDGTLYYQKPFRLKMLRVVVSRLLLRPDRWKEALVVLRYRRLRERWDSSDTGRDLEYRQYEKTGEAFGLSAGQVEKIILYWMHSLPLEYLLPYRDEEAAGIIRDLQKKKIMTVVYSDYPTADKLKALQIEVAESFAGPDSEIACLKPNPGGLEYILKRYHVAKEDAVMIGDRMEKDGEAARQAGIDYFILKRKKKERRLQYQKGIGQ